MIIGRPGEAIGLNTSEEPTEVIVTPGNEPQPGMRTFRSVKANVLRVWPNVGENANESRLISWVPLTGPT